MHSGHTRVEARGYYWMSSLIAFHLSFWDRLSYITWSLLIKLDWLANELRQEDHLSLPCQHAPRSVVTDVYCHSWLYMIAEDPNVSPHAWTKYFTATFPALQVSDSVYHVFPCSDIDLILLSPSGFKLSFLDPCSQY